MKKILALVAILGASYSLQGAKKLKYADIKSRVAKCQMTPAQADQTAYAKSALTGPHYNRVQKQELVALYQTNCAKKPGPSATKGGGATPAPITGGGTKPAPTPAPAGPSTPSLSDKIRNEVEQILKNANESTGLRGAYNSFADFVRTTIEEHLIPKYINPVIEAIKPFDDIFFNSLKSVASNEALTPKEQKELLETAKENIQQVIRLLKQLKEIDQHNLNLDDKDYDDYQKRVNAMRNQYILISRSIKPIISK